MANAEPVLIDGIYYQLNAKKGIASVVNENGTSYTSSYSGDIVIPESIVYEEVTYSVIAIGTRAFYYCQGLTSVTIPISVTSIMDQAFIYCSDMASVTVPNSVTSIGTDAFRNCVA